MDPIPQIILISLCVGSLIASVLASAIDARKRNRGAPVVGAICLITWPLGSILWLMHRPPPPLEREK